MCFHCRCFCLFHILLRKVFSFLTFFAFIDFERKIFSQDYKTYFNKLANVYQPIYKCVIYNEAPRLQLIKIYYLKEEGDCKDGRNKEKVKKETRIKVVEQIINDLGFLNDFFLSTVSCKVRGRVLLSEIGTFVKV